MLFIIDTTYFDGGELNLPGTATVSGSEIITDLISIYEPEYLKMALGYPLWKLLQAALPTPAADSRFDKLLNGSEYVDGSGNTQYWTGLKTMFNTPIAMYVWYWYQRKIASYSTPQGEQKGKTENAVNVGVDTKQMQHYNKMNRVTCQMHQFLHYSKNEDGSKMFDEFKLAQTKAFGVLNTGNL